MRTLFFESKTAPFFLSLDTPPPKELTLLEECFPKLHSSVFSLESETLVRIAVGPLLTNCKNYLDGENTIANLRTPKAIEWILEDGRSLGTGKGVGGFSIDGIPGSANVRHGEAEIKMFFDGEERTSVIQGSRVKVDNGELKIHFRSGSTTMDFTHTLHQCLSRKKLTHVWIKHEL